MNQGKFYIVPFTFSLTALIYSVFTATELNLFTYLGIASIINLSLYLISDLKYSKTTCSAVLGCAYGDEGKGKITKVLLSPNKFAWSLNATLREYIEQYKTKVCIRFSGANNAGHTVYNDKGEKIITHSVPTGIVNGCISIIGKGCLVNPDALKEEMQMLRSFGINQAIYVDRNAHVITDEHISKDSASENKLETSNTEFTGSGANGSTKKGVRFCAADKALRTGKRVYELEQLFQDVPGFVMINTGDFLKELEQQNAKDYWCGLNIIAEGAQGYKLDPDTGDYPFVTSTGCNLSQVYTSGIIPKWMDLENGIWGAQKLVTSYVGSRNFMRPDCPDLVAFQKFPSCPERGATTERWRQIDYPNMKDWVDAIDNNNVNNLVVNKCDIINAIYFGRYPEKGTYDTDELDDYQFERESHGNILTLLVPKSTPMQYYAYPHEVRTIPKKVDDTYKGNNEDDMMAVTFYDNDCYFDFIRDYLHQNCRTLKNVYFSYSPKKI